MSIITPQPTDTSIRAATFKTYNIVVSLFAVVLDLRAK